MSKLHEYIDNLKTLRRPIIWALQIGVFVFSAVTAFLLRFDFSVPSPNYLYLAAALPIWIVVKIAVFRVAKLDRGLWKYVSVTDLVRVGIGNLVASALSCALILAVAPPGFPRSIFALDLRRQR